MLILVTDLCELRFRLESPCVTDCLEDEKNELSQI